MLHQKALLGEAFLGKIGNLLFVFYQKYLHGESIAPPPRRIAMTNPVNVC
jgi:hypothetical protein